MKNSWLCVSGCLLALLLAGVPSFADAGAGVAGTGILANPGHQDSLVVVMLEALLGGLAAVVTPYVYAVLPITLSYISIVSKTGRHKRLNSLSYAGSLLAIFTALGLLVSLIIGTTGLDRLTHHWIFNLFFCRIFLGLGLSFLGAFEINLPMRWMRKIDSLVGVEDFRGIFYLALILPLATISSTGPIVGLVLVFAGKGGLWAPTAAMAAFSLGFCLPVMFPVILNGIAKSINWLNHVKVLLGFFSLLIGIKFLANADVALGWNVLDHDVFIIIWMLLAVMMGLYMLGYIHFSNDYLAVKNIYGTDFVSLSRLFLAVAFFAFAVYLLPGLWGAPLPRVSSMLPQIHA